MKYLSKEREDCTDIHPLPDPQSTVLVRELGDGPVVVDGIAPHGVAKVVVTARDALHALGGRQAVRGALHPSAVRAVE